MLTLHDVVSYPDYSAANPYQRLLAAHLTPAAAHGFGSIANARNLLRSNPPDRPVVFHLHWEDRVFNQLRHEPEAWAAARAFVAELEGFVDEGGYCVWTVHNERPHRDRFPAVLDEMRRCLVELADVLVAHGPAAAERVRAALGVEEARIVIVPHGHFFEPYGFGAGAEDVAPADGPRRFLLFGRLDAYKGIDRLLEAFERLDADWRLVVAGHVVEDALADVRALPATARARIELRQGFVAERAVKALFDEAHVVVLPYERVLTSGALMLALSAGRAVVAPAMTTIQEIVVDRRESWLFRPRSTPELLAALEAAATTPAATLAAMGRAASETARRYPWSRSGRMQSAVYAEVLQIRRARRRLPADATSGESA